MKFQYTEYNTALLPFIESILVFGCDDANTKANLPLFADGFPGLMYHETPNGLFVNPHKKRMPSLFLYGQLQNTRCDFVVFVLFYELGESWRNLNFFWKYIMFSFLLKRAFQDHKLQEKKAPTLVEAFVIPLVRHTNQLYEDLRRINRLKGSPYQYDVGGNQPKQSQTSAKVSKLKK